MSVKLIFSVFCITLCAGGVIGQSFQEQLYTAYISGDMDSWERAMTVKSKSIKTDQDRFELALAYYGFIGYCLGTEQKKRARPYLDKGEELAEVLVSKHPEQADYLAVRGAYYGFRIGFQPQKAPFIGPSALRTVNAALLANPQSPYSLIESGNKNWWMPEIFGGSKDQALKDYEEAIRIMESHPDDLKNNWYYLNVQMILADWYAQREMQAKSRYMYRRIVTFEPGFQWAKEKI